MGVLQTLTEAEIYEKIIDRLLALGFYEEGQDRLHHPEMVMDIQINKATAVMYGEAASVEWCLLSLFPRYEPTNEILSQPLECEVRAIIGALPLEENYHMVLRVSLGRDRRAPVSLQSSLFNVGFFRLECSAKNLTNPWSDRRYQAWTSAELETIAVMSERSTGEVYCTLFGPLDNLRRIHHILVRRHILDYRCALISYEAPGPACSPLTILSKGKGGPQDSRFSNRRKRDGTASKQRKGKKGSQTKHKPLAKSAMSRTTSKHHRRIP